MEEVAQSEPILPTTQEVPPPLATDPPIPDAEPTETEAETQPITNGVSGHVETSTNPDGDGLDVGAVNAAAETNWEATLSASAGSGPEGWVDVPRDPTETDTGTGATPAAVTTTQSWAEDVPPEQNVTVNPSAPVPTNGNDGFHEVHHNRGRGRGGFQGEYRGNRGRGSFRGDRGGEGGYRARGGYRGDRGGEGGYRPRGRNGPRGQRGRGEVPS